MSKGSAPSSPDPYQSAAAQYQYGTQAAAYNKALNSTDTVTPTGTTSYQISGYDPTTGAPMYTQTTALSAPQQQLLNTQQSLEQGNQGIAGQVQQQLAGIAGTGAPQTPALQYGVNGTAPVQTSLNTSNVPGIGPTQGYEQYGQNTALAGEEAAIMPGLQQQQEQLDSSLRNSGAHPGDPAYDNAMAAFNAQVANAQTQAAGAAITAGTGLQNTQYNEAANTNQQLFGEDLSAGQFANTAAGQQFSQGLSGAQLNNQTTGQALQNWATQTGVPLNQLQALMGGTQVNTPQGIAPAQSSTSAPDIMSAFQNQYAGQLAGYNANVASSNAALSDASSLGAAYLMYLGLA
nr:hypothetical protein [uncultured Rhodopila sp.]